MRIILSQPASPQCDPLPRRVAVDTESEEPGRPPRSPAIGTGPDGPGMSRFETSREEEGLFSFETSIDSFLVQISQAPRRSMFCFNQISEWMTTARQPHNKPPLAKSSRDHKEAAAARDDRVVNRSKQTV